MSQRRFFRYMPPLQPWSRSARETVTWVLNDELPEATSDQRSVFLLRAESIVGEICALSDEPTARTLNEAMSSMARGLEETVDAYEKVGTRCRCYLNSALADEQTDRELFLECLQDLLSLVKSTRRIMETDSRRRPGVWSESLVTALATVWEDVFGLRAPATISERGFHRIASEVHAIAFGCELNSRRFLAGMRHHRRRVGKVQVSD